MKKFKNFGYKQETIEVREISMGNLVHIICQALIAKDKKDMEIRIVDCYAGEVDVYNGMEDLLMQDFIFDSYMTDGKHQVKCLGVEDFWGNVWEWIDGLVTDSSNPINILTNTDNFQDNGKGAGYMTTSSGMSSGNGGWLKEPQGNTEAGFTFKASGGSSTTYFTDYAYLAGGYVAYFGGSWSLSDYAGAFCLYVAFSASVSDGSVSARLMYL